jgi:UPF0042 nucleotide-binding protein
MSTKEFLIVSGLSGAGKSRAATALEDIGYYCVDNMPPELIPDFAELANTQRHKRVALVVDIRMGESFEALFEAMDTLRSRGYLCRTLFLEADRDALLRRYKETRRPHPLSGRDTAIEKLLDEERLMLAPVREQADHILNTTYNSAATTREQINELFSGDGGKNLLTVQVISFGHKYGSPAEADMVFDVRFIPNPFYEAGLRDLTGLDADVFDFVCAQPQTAPFLEHLRGMMDFLLPQFKSDGRVSLVIGIGCTGGRHRSVSIARVLEERIRRAGYRTLLTHRDLGR